MDMSTSELCVFIGISLLTAIAGVMNVIFTDAAISISTVVMQRFINVDRMPSFFWSHFWFRSVGVALVLAGLSTGVASLSSCTK